MLSTGESKTAQEMQDVPGHQSNISTKVAVVIAFHHSVILNKRKIIGKWQTHHPIRNHDDWHNDELATTSLDNSIERCL
jgi:hypothetical protein